MKKNKKLISILIIISLLLSFSFVSISNSHEMKCHEDNCKYCEIIKMVENNTKSVLILASCSFILLFTINKNIITFKSNYYPNKTLVSLKTRLDN